MQTPMNALDATEAVLRDEGGPLHYREITERILKRRLWVTGGATPDATVNAALGLDIQERGNGSRFERVSHGTYALRNVRRKNTDPSVDKVASRAKIQPTGQGKAREKLGVQELREVARQIVKDSPEGIRYGQLLTQILDRHPATPPKTVQSAVWNLDAHFPDEIHKPSRGLFKAGADTPEPVVKADKATSTPRPPDRHKEEAFYEPFADWLKNDIGDATDAIPLGGAGLRSKWGTPDVIGVYKPQPSDRIKFPHEIISAEIKVEPQAPVVAFGQAVAYRLFSTKTYIVMPRTITTEDLDRLEALCMLFGVGLILFTLDPEQPDFAIRMRAQRFSPDMYFVNEFADGLHRLNKDMFNRLFQ
jgi:hypothetical protein